MKDEQIRAQIHQAVDAHGEHLRTDPFLAQRIMHQERTGKPIVNKKLSVGLVLAVVLTLIAAAAFALANGFGLMDFWRNSWGDAEIPEDAGKYIENDIIIDETEHFTVRFRETSYDGKTCHVVYDVIPKDKDLFLFEGYLDESWYALTHLNPDREKMKEDGRTVQDRWDEGGFSSGWIVDIDAGSDTEFIREYGGGGVLDEETGIYTGQIDVPLDSLKEERTLWFSVRMLPLKDMHDENSMDYDHAENGYMEKTFHAAVSGEETILTSTSPVLFPAIGVRVDQVRLMILPQEIQYRIDYSVTDSALYHSLFDEHPDADHTVTVPPAFRFVTTAQESGEPVILPRGITQNYTGYDIDEEKGLFRQTGSLGRSSFADTYTLAAYHTAAVYSTSPVPIEAATFPVDVQDPDTLTPEEREWQQKAD